MSQWQKYKITLPSVIKLVSVAYDDALQFYFMLTIDI
jgi:hypothetical protein